MSSKVGREELERLTPLLGSTARLIAHDGGVADDQLYALLLGADLDPTPDLLAELGLWVRILHGLRRRPNEGLRLATVESLMMRGIPESPAILATITVMESAIASRPVPSPFAGAPTDSSVEEPGPLTASVQNINFGTLETGTGASRQFTVEGGPGQIRVESDQLRVQPTQFGAEITTVQVELLPIARGSLWTRMQLTAGSRSLELPVVAEWTEESGDGTIAPRGPSHLSQESMPVMVPEASRSPMTADGRISVRVGELERALAHAAAGATLQLAAGEHRLDAGVVVERGLTLLGAGHEATSIVTGAGAAVLRYNGSGPLTLRDLTMHWTGTAGTPATVLEVAGGEALVERCSLMGATSSDPEWGAGISVTGTAQIIVRDCQVSGNGIGITVGEQATAILEGNICNANKCSGIAFWGTAAGTARNNTCTENVKVGIYVYVQATPTLEGNTCTANHMSGIGYVGIAAGIARSNTCRENEQHGIDVDEQAQPTLEGNTCIANHMSGIAYSGTAAGTARNNTCRENVHFGIAVGGQVQPTLEGNTCTANHWSGIVYVGTAAGIARSNTVLRTLQTASLSVNRPSQPLRATPAQRTMRVALPTPARPLAPHATTRVGRTSITASMSMNRPSQPWRATPAQRTI